MEALSTKRRGATSTRGIRMSDTKCDSRYSVLVRLLVTNQVCNIFEVVNVLLCYALQNLLGIINKIQVNHIHALLGFKVGINQNLTPLDDYDQPLPPHCGSRVRSKSTDHVALNMKSTLVSAKVMAGYLLDKEKLRKDLKSITSLAKK